MVIFPVCSVSFPVANYVITSFVCFFLKKETDTAHIPFSPSIHRGSTLYVLLCTLGFFVFFFVFFTSVGYPSYYPLAVYAELPFPLYTSSVSTSLHGISHKLLL